MPQCVMCGKITSGYYDSTPKIPICFEHYEDGSLADYLVQQRPVEAKVLADYLAAQQKPAEAEEHPVANGMCKFLPPQSGLWHIGEQCAIDLYEDVNSLQQFEVDLFAFPGYQVGSFQGLTVKQARQRLVELGRAHAVAVAHCVAAISANVWSADMKEIDALKRACNGYEGVRALCARAGVSLQEAFDEAPRPFEAFDPRSEEALDRMSAFIVDSAENLSDDALGEKAREIVAAL